MIRASVAVEGPLDEAVIKRLFDAVKIEMGTVYGKEGKNALHSKISGYNRAAQFSPWVVLVDLNHEQDCAPSLRNDWLPEPASNMYLRVAVRKLESWLLADHSNIASFLGVSKSVIPHSPDTEDDSKITLVNLARRSRFSSIRYDLVPTQKSGRHVGVAYTSRMTDFVTTIWDPEQASQRSPSLARCVAALKNLSMPST